MLDSDTLPREADPRDAIGDLAAVCRTSGGVPETLLLTSVQAPGDAEAKQTSPRTKKKLFSAPVLSRTVKSLSTQRQSHVKKAVLGASADLPSDIEDKIRVGTRRTKCQFSHTDSIPFNQ